MTEETVQKLLHMEPYGEAPKRIVEQHKFEESEKIGWFLTGMIMMGIVGAFYIYCLIIATNY